MPDEQFLMLQMHELLTYLGQQGVVTMLVLAQHGFVGAMQTPVDASYLAIRSSCCAFSRRPGSCGVHLGREEAAAAHMKTLSASCAAHRKDCGWGSPSTISMAS